MSRITFLIILFAFYLVFDLYTYFGLKGIIGSQNNKWYNVIYWTISFSVILGFFKVYLDLQSLSGDVRPLLTNLLLGFGFTVFVAKFLFAGLLLSQDAIRFIVGLFRGGGSIAGIEIEGDIVPSRRKFVTTLSAGLVAIPFLSMLYGITKGKYQFQVEKLKLTFKDLPKAFNGFKIVQITDIHSGSYDSVEQVEKGIQMVMEQKPDLIVFTGDLVNSDKDEIDPFLDVFAKLNAPYGMYSIMGNHDYYGLYRIGKKSENEEEQQVYLDDFNAKHQHMGFDLLNNTSRVIRKDGDEIRLIGVENWGRGPFPKKGDLNKALEGVKNDEFCVLLSHDPTHWDDHVKHHNQHIHLTLSGHTHGMQFGINVPGLKWSPIKYRYDKWMGLYEELGQYLYINRGFGFLGFPGRVGMTPEITVIELQSQNA